MMASTFQHIGLDLTPQNSDPAKFVTLGPQKQQPKGNFCGAEGLNFAVLRLTLTSHRKARAVYVDKRANTTVSSYA